MRRISSLKTFVLKYVFSFVWIAGFGFAALAAIFTGFRGQHGSAALLGPQMAFPAAWVIGSIFIYWTCIRLKRVALDETWLYVSNYRREVRIPLSDIAEVTENIWINIHPVTIRLSRPCEFGDTIVFMPTWRLFSAFSSHPVVAELRVVAARGRG